jgi:RNAse (barnase) inhibitor barstar
MACFSKEEIDLERLDWVVIRDGGVSLYLREEILREDLKVLESYDYQVVAFDCATWDSVEQMHLSFQESLNFPNYYGRNLDALNDCVTEDIRVPDTGGLVIVLRNVDRYPENRTALAGVLSVFARASRRHMLTGHRFLTFVQTNDPRERFDSFDCRSAIWNHREWLNKARGL